MGKPHELRWVGKRQRFGAAVSSLTLQLALCLITGALLTGCLNRRFADNYGPIVPPAVSSFSAHSGRHTEGDSGSRHPVGITLLPPIEGKQDVQQAVFSSDGASEGGVAERVPRLLDFPTVLAEVSGRNPQVAFAQQRVSEAFAQLQAAQVLWLPSVRGGVSYNKHDGRLQDVEARMLDVNRSAWQYGMGVGAVVAGNPSIHGLWANFHVADAVFQPHVAAHAASASQAAFTAELNDTLLDAALAYLALLDANQHKEIAEETAAHAKKLADLTTVYAKTGLGTEADADRAQAEAVFRQNNLQRANEAIAVASARLAQLLSQDPTVPLLPVEFTVVPIELVCIDRPVQELVAEGLTNRPELNASRALVDQAIAQWQRQRFAPFLPSVLLGLSDSRFGGGQGSRIGSPGHRFDVDAIAYWELRNLGFGEKAARHEARARVDQAKYREIQTLDLVAREVAEAYSQVVWRKRQIALAQAGVQAAKDSYERNLRRIRDVQGLPIEVLQSIQALDQARREYLRTLVDYNEAQFRLYRALGWPSFLPHGETAMDSH